MRRLALIATVLVLAGGHFAAAAVGVRDIAIPVPERKATLHVFVWYPAGPGGKPVLIGDNGVFRGTPALENAPALNGRFPLILIADGGLRAAPNLGSWLAFALASRGFIAALVNPPPIPAGPARQSVVRELWLRPADLSATIVAVERDPAFTSRVDTKKVGGVGFFLGGYAVLALTGARIDPVTYAHSCEGWGAGPDCTWFAQGGVNLHRVDAGRLGGSHFDPYLKVAVLIDPELSAVLTRRSLSAISVPVYLVSLRSTETIPSALAFTKLAAQIPGARYLAIKDAGPFNSFAECKPSGPAILESAGGESQLCSNGKGRSRAAIHAQLAAVIAGSLQNSFGSY